MNRTGFPSKQCQPGVRDLYFVFQTNGAGAPATANFSGAKSFIASVTHTGASNDYVVTLSDPAQEVLYASAELESTDGHYLLLKQVANEASGTANPAITFLCFAAGGAAANDFTAGAKVLVHIAVRDTTVTG